MKFNTHSDLATHLVDEVLAALPKRPEVELKDSYSNVSDSAYLNVTLWEIDEDGDPSETLGGCKVRFSNHADRYGSDLSIRFDNVLDSDEFGDVYLADWRIKEMVAEAVVFIVRELKEQADE